MSILIESLSKHYGDQKAVDNISLDIAEKGVVGFLGPNGAGKSTTMKMLTCFIPPTSGTAVVCGYSILEDPIEVRKNVGYLPENNPLYKDMYVREYLNYIADIYKIGNKTKKVNDVIEMTGLAPEIRKLIGQLSKGYKQRVGLAQALLHDPEVLILDEPTSGLDPNQLSEIRQLIRDLGKEKTLILSSHIMQEVQAVCDRVIIINKGEIVADDPIESLNRNAGLVLRVRFKSLTDSTRLHAIPGVEKVESVGAHEFLIHSNSNDINEAIFQFAKKHDQTLLIMQDESKQLEEVFKQLTRN
ncbi:MAG: ATP-binding cassette domain-containing protein [Chitinophagales bacterium]|nr:ATP-binding cassette domain-containing protein [Chitinophagales bacterium]